MPFSIPCANTFCDGHAEKMGEVCRDCKKRENPHAHDWRAVGWTRYQDNESAKPGHKNGKKGK